MNVIVTGAGSGIGRELVIKFSKIPGCKVIAVSRNNKKLVQLVKNYPSVVGIPFELSSLHLYKSKLFPLIKRTMKEVDILVNNAGQLINKPFEKILFSEWEQLYRVNVFAPVMMAKMLIPLMGKKRRGHIVNIGSMGGVTGSVKFSGLSAYSSSKAALMTLSECMGVEFGVKNISVNALALGSVQTEMLEKAFPGFKAQVTPAEMADFIVDFSVKGADLFNGKVIQVSTTTP